MNVQMENPEKLQKIPRMPETICFPLEEENIISLWKKLDVFQNCLKQSKGKPRYSFYDGPPFATGLPHYGHILTGTIKDVVTRYAHQQGYHVERRFGWDCHGLPVEFEIDKTLGITGPDDVAKMGIAKYNSECRKIVARYVKEWEIVVERIGRWVDFKNDYKTMYPWYMESIWWVFKQLYLKGLVYQGNKVMPYSPACNTPLSNFEAGENYKTVSDPAITVALSTIGDIDGASLLIWTTTPWTLPSNLAACVNASSTYARLRHLRTGNVFIMLVDRLEFVFDNSEDYEILSQFPGIELKDLQYQPVFPYYADLREQGAFRVLVDDYVTATSGTGVVHLAPYFGEDDYRVCLAAGIITRDQEPICPVDPSGRFTHPVVDFERQYFKDADENIISYLNENGSLVKSIPFVHSYPFCWRSDKPLMYRAVPSWFIRVEHMSGELLTQNATTYWVPEAIKDNRFGNWLHEARDWAVSRNRYWGTPIPIWKSEKEIYCVGSIKELEELTGTNITDLHRESIDHLEIPSKISGNPPLRRIPEVFDCWFESGCMPYAQQHFPFGDCKEFKKQFPADFISEGVDQTRGWFYTLLVISTALFGKPPFKNLIANGLVLDKDGQKMSKSKKNYPDPLEIVNRYGADALRLYLINSPVVQGNTLWFKEEGVKSIPKDVFLPWYNACRFLMQNLELYVKEYKLTFHYNEIEHNSRNIMDRWIISFTQSLLLYISKEMALYRLYNVVPRLIKYIDQLTNWYVRMNRKRLKGESGRDDCKQALLTLFNVSLTITKLMAPFSPFLAEYIYQYLKIFTNEPADSVHYLMLPQANGSLIDTTIERAVSRMQAVIELGRKLRDMKTIPVRYPLPEIVVLHEDPQYIAEVESLQSYVLSEMNVRALTLTTDKSKYGIQMKAKPNYKRLGLRLKHNFKFVDSAINGLTGDKIEDMVRERYCIVADTRLELDEVILYYKVNVNSKQYAVNSNKDVLVLLNVKPDQSLIDEGIAREIINRIQKLRKRAKLVPTDKIVVVYKTSGDLERIAREHANFIEKTIKAPFRYERESDSCKPIIVKEYQELKEWNLLLLLQRQNEWTYGKLRPRVKWVNVQLFNLKSQYGDKDESTKGVVLLEVNNKVLSLFELKMEIMRIFGISNFTVWCTNGLVYNDQIPNLSGNTLFVLPEGVKFNYVKDNAKRCIELPEGDNLINDGDEAKEVTPFCNILNFCIFGIKGSLILENPSGVRILSENQFDMMIDKWINNTL